ncbi:Postreplication repair E3 ubiquitin-protein ligase RAD18 [Aphelenchoides besseyi]|nr:Postreplication repair E3 ubiquitin-protein ligase RAD18 [Aphelenchoides besseyi]
MDVNSDEAHDLLVNSGDELFNCYLCGKQFVEPVVLNECSHRFCLKCLREYVKANQKCPICLNHCGHKPAFKRDQAFELALKIVNATEKETESRESSMDAENYWEQNDYDDLNVVLCPHSTVFQLDLPQSAVKTRFLQIHEDATVEHLLEFLALRTKIEDQFELKEKFKIEIAPAKWSDGPSCSKDATNELDTGVNNNVHNMNQPYGRSVDSVGPSSLSYNTFESLRPNMSLIDVIREHRLNVRWPLELSFRFTHLPTKSINRERSNLLPNM